METNEIYKLQLLLKTATESINEAMALTIKPQVDELRKRKIYVTQQRPKGSEYDECWTTLFADTDYDKAKIWADTNNDENSIVSAEYRVITIDLYLY